MKDDITSNINNDMDYTERAYTTSEIATMLDIAVPTVRKYAQSLERANYVFIKGKEKGKHPSRLFIESDIMALRYLIQLRSNSNITDDEAVSIVISKYGKGSIQSIRSNDIAEVQPYGEQYNELKELIHKQNEIIQNLAKQLDKQQEYIDNKINDRDKELMQSISELMENKKQIAAAEQAEAKRGFLSKLFNKRGGE